MNGMKFSIVLVALLIGGIQAAEDTPVDPNWNGLISLGWSSARGNSHNDNLSASASAEKRWEKDRFSAAADYARSRQKNTTTNEKSTTEDWWRLLAQYDHFFSPKWFGFVNGQYGVDKIALLDYRFLLGTGAGYQLLENDRSNVSFIGGIAYKNESYQNSEDSSDMTLQLGYNVGHKFVETLQLLHDLTYYPVIDNFSDYYLTSSLELRGNFTKNLFSNFKILYARDATPAPGRKNSDIKYILGLGWNF